MENTEYLGEQRTIFSLNDKNVDYIKHIFGLTLFITVFVITIPYFLIKYEYWNILSAYFPNLDMIATILGYHGGPVNTFVWQHLYNPSDTTITGYVTSNLINLFALLGVVVIIIHFTLSSKNMYLPMARAVIMLPMTYFLPGNFIVYYMNKFGKFLNRFFLSKSIQHYLLVVVLGFFVAITFILSEAILIKYYVPVVAKLIKKISESIL
jgi:hypothetical protein